MSFSRALARNLRFTHSPVLNGSPPIRKLSQNRRNVRVGDNTDTTQENDTMSALPCQRQPKFPIMGRAAGNQLRANRPLHLTSQ